MSDNNILEGITVRKITGTLIDVFFGPEWSGWVRLVLRQTRAVIIAGHMYACDPLTTEQLEEIHRVYYSHRFK